MSLVCKANFESNLQTQIDRSSCNSAPSDLMLLSVSANRNDSVNVVPGMCLEQWSAINTSLVPNGQIAFSSELGVPLIKCGSNWFGFDGRQFSASTVSNEIWSWGYVPGTFTTWCIPIREACSAADWCSISGGFDHHVAIKTDNSLWTFGSNTYCQFGIGAGSGNREICSATDWRQVSGGTFFSLAVKSDNSLWGWGRNQCAQLGIGTILNRNIPTREICSANDWCLASAGVYHGVAIKTNGSIWAWGRNSNGELGNGTVADRCSPGREICSATDWCSVVAGDRVTAAIKTNGSLWMWGAGFFGVLGDGTTTGKCSPIREISSATNWCTLALGRHSTHAVKTDGTLWNWGYNCCGKLGNGSLTTCTCSPVREICSASNWNQVDANPRTCFNTTGENVAATKIDGSLWVWGSGCCFLSFPSGTTACPRREPNSFNDWCSVALTFRTGIGIRRNVSINRTL